jgi:hypothetical protein
MNRSMRLFVLLRDDRVRQVIKNTGKFIDEE